MTPGAVCALTDFILATEVFLLTGYYLAKIIHLQSASFSWAMTLVFLGIGALIGGIEHGFIEPLNKPNLRKKFKLLTYFFIGLLTISITMTLTFRFFPKSWHSTLFTISLIQFFIFLRITYFKTKFIFVILNYAPWMLAFLIFNIIGLSNQSGSIGLVIGITLGLLGSIIQASKFDKFSPIDHNSIYHIIMMVAIIFLFIGGFDLL